MSCGDATTMSSSNNGTSNGTTATVAGVSLGSAIERLLYFNGRFLKAEDLKLEQTGYLTRIALSERAQGAGVSYGFHVTTATSAAPDSFVKSVADAVFAKMQANPKEWVAFLDAEQGKPSPDQPPPVDAPPDKPPPATPPPDKPPPDNTALMQRLAGALDTLCGAGPGNASGLVFTIAPGHAADGTGRDLLLGNPHQVKLSKLIDAFTTAPTFTDAPGPVVTPKPLTSAPPLTGAFLLTIRVDDHDHGNVPVYGAQCTDAKTAACSLGYRSNGLAAQLVFFDALESVSAAEWWNWRGMGARAYFEKETATRPSLLPNMLSTLPFSAAAQAPETGTHVPIGMVYLQNGNFVTFDPWTSKRLRSPGELTYWLRSLLYPPQVSQLARVLQFQSQLTDALSGGVGGSTTNLWTLGFADGAELVLPGVGFLPVQATDGGDYISAMSAATLTPILEAYFDGVPYQIMEASEGEMNALFVGALESGELRLTRTAPSGGGGGTDDGCKEVIAEINSAVKGYYAAPPSEGTAGAVIKEVTGLVEKFTGGTGKPPAGAPSGPAQVFVWFTPNPFPGYVMFTWPAPLPKATATPTAPTALPRVCTQARLVPVGWAPTTGAKALPYPPFEVLGHDGEWATHFTSGMGSFFYLAGFRLELEHPSPALMLNYAFVMQKFVFTETSAGAVTVTVTVDVTATPDDKGWLTFPKKDPNDARIPGLKIWLTGEESKNYSVIYRIRLRLGDYFYIDTPTVQNGQILSALTSVLSPALQVTIPPTVYLEQLGKALKAFNNPVLAPMENPVEAIWVSIVPRCPSEPTEIILPLANAFSVHEFPELVRKAGDVAAGGPAPVWMNVRWGR